MAAAFVFCLLCSAALHAEQWNKTYALTGKPTLHVNTDDADVRIHSCDCKQVQARVEWDGYKPGQVQVTESQSGDAIDLRVRAHDSHIGINFQWRHQWVRVDISVPKEADVDAHTGDGHMDLEDVKGDLELRSGDGKIKVSGVDGMLRAHTGDGSAKLSGRFDVLDVTTSDGAVDIEVKDGSVIRSGWEIQSGDGAVHVRLPANFAADLRAKTGDGSIHTEFPVTITGDLKDRNRMEGKLNGGGGVLTIRTGDGDVYLEKM